MTITVPVRSSTQWQGAALALGAMFSVQVGAAVSVPIMMAHGSFGITTMRLGVAALALLLLVRPRFLRFSRAQWIGALTLGACTSFTTMIYYEAVTRIPMGAASTIEFYGPLAVGVAALRGWSRLGLPLLAGAGILAMTFSPEGWLLDPLGVLLALMSGCGWATYIVMTRRVGRLFSELDGLCVSMVFAALLALPATVWLSPADLTLDQLPTAAILAVLTPLIPYPLEMLALRRLNIGAFSILMSLEPALGALFAFLLLGQNLSLQQTAGIVMVMVASIAAVYFTTDRGQDAAGGEGAVEVS